MVSIGCAAIFGGNMADYNFERFAVLVVEDSAFMRTMMLNALKSLRIGVTKTCNDGGEAIEFMQLMQSDPMKAGVQKIDIIMSNWAMSPVDGMMFLRWVRRHKDSPDRFIPFLMITGYSAESRIHEARDLGVTEFLCKPFAIKAICEKVLAVVDRPRQFVHTRDYFGPDRRRNKLEFEGPERRKLTDDSAVVEIVRG